MGQNFIGSDRPSSDAKWSVITAKMDVPMTLMEIHGEFPEWFEEAGSMRISDAEEKDGRTLFTLTSYAWIIERDSLDDLVNELAESTDVAIVTKSIFDGIDFEVSIQPGMVQNGTE